MTAAREMKHSPTLPGLCGAFESTCRSDDSIRYLLTPGEISPPPTTDEAEGGKKAERESGEYIPPTEYLSRVEPLSSRRDAHTILRVHK